MRLLPPKRSLSGCGVSKLSEAGAKALVKLPNLVMDEDIEALKQQIPKVNGTKA